MQENFHMQFASRVELFSIKVHELTRCSSSPRRIVALIEMKGSEDVMTSTRLCNKSTIQNAVSNVICN